MFSALRRLSVHTGRRGAGWMGSQILLLFKFEPTTKRVEVHSMEQVSGWLSVSFLPDDTTKCK